MTRALQGITLPGRPASRRRSARGLPGSSMWLVLGTARPSFPRSSWQTRGRSARASSSGTWLQQCTRSQVWMMRLIPSPCYPRNPLDLRRDRLTTTSRSLPSRSSRLIGGVTLARLSAGVEELGYSSRSGDPRRTATMITQVSQWGKVGAVSPPVDISAESPGQPGSFPSEERAPAVLFALSLHMPAGRILALFWISVGMGTFIGVTGRSGDPGEARRHPRGGEGSRCRVRFEDPGDTPWRSWERLYFFFLGLVFFLAQI